MELDEYVFWDDKEIADLLRISRRKSKALLRTPGAPVVHVGREYRAESHRFVKWLMESDYIKPDYSKI